MAQQHPSCVYLIGAGPGDPGLITVKGRDLLGRADVVLYDHLISAQLLNHARPNARLVHVGKRAGKHMFTQEQINQMLLDYARQVPCVVRLKGGDPFVFGRGGEEAAALKDAGIAFEIVPGITAGIAAPAYAGIPITHRDLASDVAFITGHETANRVDGSQIDWPALARWRGTIVFYMGVTKLADICNKLIEQGKASDTPVAIIRWATTEKQKTIIDTLGQLAEKSQQLNLRPPAIIVIGKVVNLRKQIAWFENRPLFGRQIIVTRAQTQASRLTDALTHLGAHVIECPVIQCTPLDDPQPLQNAIDHLTKFDWIFFTSTNAVDAFFDQLRCQNLDARAIAPAKIAAVGIATAESLKKLNLVPDHFPETFTAVAAAEELAQKEKLAGKNILLPRSQIAPPDLPETLKKHHANVTEVIAYQTLPDTSPKDHIRIALEENNIDWITFTSSSTVTHFLAQFDLKKTGGPNLKIASIGPATSETLRVAGLRPTVQADPHTVDGLVTAINQYTQTDK